MLRQRKNQSQKEKCENAYQIESQENEIFKLKNETMVETLVLGSSEMYVLSVLGAIDTMVQQKLINMKSLKNIVSSSLGTIVSLYLSFDYTPKEIFCVFAEMIELHNDIIFKIMETGGIFEISPFIDSLLKPLIQKIGFIPTLNDVYEKTGKNLLFITYNLTKGETVTMDRTTHPTTWVSEMVKVSCIVPVMFKKYKNEVSKENDFVDYTFLDMNREVEIAAEMFPDTNTYAFCIELCDKENFKFHESTMFDFMKHLFDARIGSSHKIKYFDDHIHVYNILQEAYSITLMLDPLQRYKELLRLYCVTKKQIEKRIQEDLLVMETSEQPTEGLVLCGGGILASYISGALAGSKKLKIVDDQNVKVMIGTSAGFILCVCEILGLDEMQICDLCCGIEIDQMIMKAMLDFDIVSFVEKKYICDNKQLLAKCDQLFIDFNNGEIPTLLDVYNKYHKELVCVTYNLTQSKVEYLNYENAPDLLITHAMTMTACLPIIFSPFEYKGCLYVDGGIVSNYSIEHVQFYPDKHFLSFYLEDNIDFETDSFLQYVGKFLWKIVCKDRQKAENNKLSNVQCVKIPIDRKTNNSVIKIQKYQYLENFWNGYKYIQDTL